jgi:hypothetical protein
MLNLSGTPHISFLFHLSHRLWVQWVRIEEDVRLCDGSDKWKDMMGKTRRRNLSLIERQDQVPERWNEGVLEGWADGIEQNEKYWAKDISDTESQIAFPWMWANCPRRRTISELQWWLFGCDWFFRCDLSETIAKLIAHFSRLLNKKVTNRTTPIICKNYIISTFEMWPRRRMLSCERVKIREFIDATFSRDCSIKSLSFSLCC